MAAPASGERKQKKSSKKDKPSSSSRSASKDKDKSSKRSSKKSPSSSRSAPPTAVAEEVAPASAVQQKTPQDPNAIQLFRRYDRARAGALTRLDFLQLLKDYASPPTGVQQHSNNNDPCTQSSTSALAHLQPRKYLVAPPQFASASSSSLPPRLVSPSQAVTSRVDAAASSPSSQSAVEAKSPEMLDPKAKEDQKRQLKSEYQTSLWKLRKLFRDELLSQREQILETMTCLRDAMQQRNANSDTKPRSRWPLHDDLHSRRRTDQDDRDRQTVELYEALEEDLDKIDELEAYLRRFVKKGGSISSDEIMEFLVHANDLQEQAQYLAMKDYGPSSHLLPSSEVPKNENVAGGGRQHDAASLSSEIKASKSKNAELATPPPPATSSASNSDQEQLLRVKDQMIYQLLVEHTEMRKQLASMEPYLHELSEVSTQEMQKWARLTDEMQDEIEHLRSQKGIRSTKRA
ncbi:hypothetical protein FI667_g10406, partial [Globisporangium splendens]